MKFLGKCQNSEELYETSREIVETVDGILQFLQPCFMDNADISVKCYEDCVYKNRDIEAENEMANLLLDMQNEANDAVTFLDNISITLDSVDAEKMNHTELPSILREKEKLTALESEKAALEVILQEQKLKIEELGREFDKVSQECQHNTIDWNVEDNMEDVEKRTLIYKTLINAASTIPFKILERTQSSVTYEFRFNGEPLFVNVRDDLTVSLNPQNSLISDYIEGKRNGIKTLEEIVALIQEAIALYELDDVNVY
ncbi:hypothetical protein BEWA_026280 [Theileria equi strain WA]|uniref:Uncharacterized protein n=1 Tax=Theileria equi strain WA TaxID=1537102 RepID=L0AXY8_THEEQ|nr:hypothetical protein BEWA_026280 [Theileria equi strain WA]AFZ79779.1 hypothetical protein BEWA_026280 [Theileria equi strain WA]|eukprot:XP_004829445.1 hypothetical protein BEWA_026280 [Theileria equi strain WA]